MFNKCVGIMTGLAALSLPMILRAYEPPLLYPATTAQASTPPASSSSTTPAYESTGETIGSTTPLVGMTTRPGGEVFVTLTRTAVPDADLPNSADVVRPATFQKFDAQTAGEAVAREISIQTLPLNDEGGILTATIRGSSSDQTLVLVDGRPYSGFSLGTPDLSEIPVEAIDHIEIVRGGVSALYGPNAVGGVINVITKRAAYAGHPISHVSYEGGYFGRNAYRLDFASRQGPVDYVFYGDQRWESGFRDNSDFRSHNIGGNVGLAMGAAGKLLFDVASYHIDEGVPGAACGPNDPTCSKFIYLLPSQFNNADEKIASTPSARQTTDTRYERASYLLPLPDNMLLTLRGFASQREVTYNCDDPTNPNCFDLTSINSLITETDRQERSDGGEAQLNLPLGLLAGGSFIHDRLDNADLLVSGNSFIKSDEDWGTFLQEDFHWQTLTLIPSGRYDHNSQAGDSKNPRVQLIEDATPWLRFSGSAGRSFRAPTLDDLYTRSVGGVFTSLGNPNLRPETAWTYDAGFELHRDSDSLRATYFRANINNLIQSVTITPTTFQTMNIGEARRQGGELQITKWFGLEWKDALNYTYLQNLGEPAGYDHFVLLPFSPRHTVNDILSWIPSQRWQIDSVWRYEDARYGYGVNGGSNPFNEKLASQLLWDLRLAYHLRQADFFVGVNDIADKRYEEQPGYPLPGRTLYGGVTIRLWD